jgi:hypothetical protein
MADVRLRLSRRGARRAGLGLVLFGAIGVVLIAIVAFVLEDAYRQLELVDTGAGPLAQATSAIGDAANAFSGFGTSIGQAERSATSAATTSRNASDTAMRLADAMSLSFFGAQPFLPLAQGFRQQATDLTAMAGDLDRLAAALHQNQTDIATLHADLADLHARLGTSGVPLPLGMLRVLSGLLLLWLSVPAFASLAFGTWLLRANGRGA